MKIKTTDWRVRLVKKTFFDSYSDMPETKCGFRFALFMAIIFLIFSWPSLALGINKKNVKDDFARLWLFVVILVVSCGIGLTIMTAFTSSDFTNSVLGISSSYVLGFLVVIFFRYIGYKPFPWACRKISERAKRCERIEYTEELPF